MKQLILWMAKNHVAANILLVALVLGGLYTGFSVKQEVFPTVELDYIYVDASYPGAGAREVEEAICLPLEDALEDNLNIDKISCRASEGSARLTLELNDQETVTEVLNQVKNSVSSIEFSEHVEIRKVHRQIRRREVLSLILYGTHSPDLLFKEAISVRNELLRHDDISFIEIPDLPPEEISIEADPDLINFHNISLKDIASSVQAGSMDFPSGSLSTPEGDYSLRTTEKRQDPGSLKSIVLKNNQNGSPLTLGEISEIKGGFDSKGKRSWLDGKPALQLEVYRVGTQTPIGVSNAVKETIEKIKQSGQSQASYLIWNDRSEIFEDRFKLLLKNAALGLILVFICLSLFLKISLALWVGVGIIVSFIGSLIFLPAVGISINMISLFGFILVLGIVVDDAIIIGENIFRHKEKGKTPLKAAQDGAVEMAVPVTFAILTTIVAFTPLLMASGHMGKFIRAIPWIIVLTLSLSLIESLLILPSHLSSESKKRSSHILTVLDRLRHRCSDSLSHFTNTVFKSRLDACIENRFTTVSAAISILLICLCLVGSGFVKTVFFPRIERDVARARFNFSPGTPIEKATHLTRQLESFALQAAKDQGGSDPDYSNPIRHIYSSATGSSSWGSSSSTSGTVRVLLKNATERNFSTIEYSEDWRLKSGDYPDLDKLSFSAHWGSWGDDVSINLSHPDTELLESLTQKTKQKLKTYPALSEISDSLSKGKKEFRFELTEEAKSIGLTPSLLSTQLRAAYLGVEAFRFTKNARDVSVMVRLPENFRNSLKSLSDFEVTANSGARLPFLQAVNLKTGNSPGAIDRVNRQRITNISAQVGKDQGDPKAIIDDLNSNFLQSLERSVMGLNIELEGARKNEKHSTGDLKKGFLIAMVCIYALLAILFSSYTQPLIVMAAIPFGVAGAIIGHMILGYPLSFLSFFGIVGLSGVVVNDSLILISRINSNRKESTDLKAAILDASCTRFRPILLTSVTTFVGLMPMLAETSRQAKFLVPMAISLGVGVLFATVITLIIIPSFYMILEDIKIKLAK